MTTYNTQLADHQTQIGDNSLVSNQLNGLLSADNPYMQQATTRGNQEAQRRGLLSSSLAAGAVEGARINAALPIAQQDAQTYANADLQDSAYTQQGNLANQAFGQQQSLNQQNFGYNTQLADQSFGHNQQLQQDQFGFNTQLSDQTFQQNQQLNDQQFGYNQQLNEQQNTANAQLQQDNQIATIQRDTNAQISAIENNPNLSPAQRNEMINNALSLQSAQIQAIQSGNQVAVNFTYPPSSANNVVGPGVNNTGNPSSQQPTVPMPSTPSRSGEPWVWWPERGVWATESSIARGSTGLSVPNDPYAGSNYRPRD